MAIRVRSKTVEAYLASLPEHKQGPAEALRQLIRTTMPAGEERMSSGAPFFWHRGRRAVGYGAAQDHLSFFIMHGRVLKTHRDHLKGLNVSTTVIRLPLHQPLPEALLRNLVRARLAEIDAAVATPA